MGTFDILDFYNANSSNTELRSYLDEMFQAKYVKQDGYDDGFDYSERRLYSPSKKPFFVPGKMYTFQYTPKDKKKFDMLPILFCTGVGTTKDGFPFVQGINMNKLPNDVKAHVLNEICKMFQGEMEKQEEAAASGQTYVPSAMVKELMSEGFIMKMIEFAGINTHERFKIEYMKQPSLFELDDWKFIPLIIPKCFVGASLGEILNEFKKTTKDKLKSMLKDILEK